MSCNPNNAGASQFHNSITTAPPSAMKITIPTIAAGIIQISFLDLLLIKSPHFQTRHTLV
jgi:hypothetical protein